MRVMMRKVMRLIDGSIYALAWSCGCKACCYVMPVEAALHVVLRCKCCVAFGYATMCSLQSVGLLSMILFSIQLPRHPVWE